MTKLKAIVFAAVMCVALGACDTVDCTLNNTVLCYISFYNGEGKQVSITDTLSITAHGTNNVVFNRGVNTSSVSIPMSYFNEEDTLTFTVYGESSKHEAEIVLGKTNIQYYESPDCPVNMFHNITSAYVFSGAFIDSVVVTKPSVNFQRDENIRIYIH